MPVAGVPPENIVKLCPAVPSRFLTDGSRFLCCSSLCGGDFACCAVLSLFVPHLFFVWCIWRAMLRDSMFIKYQQSGPSCSKLTMSLVNDSLKFTSSDTQIC